MNTFKKGLLIGINYTGTCSELNGCINDTENLRYLLIKNKYFCDNELTFMNDHKTDKLYPSKKNILLQMNELVNFANEHTNANEKVNLFFSYSGHGSRINDTNRDEKDGLDEVLCPIDYDTDGFIIDDDVKSLLIDKLNSNVTLTVIIDACHSGSILDLKYLYECDSKDTCNANWKIQDSKCNVIMISGCKDDQTSADAFIGDNVTKQDEYQGAMTAAFIENYADKIPTKTLILKMREWLKTNNYTQIPQISSGKILYIMSPFILSTLP